MRTDLNVNRPEVASDPAYDTVTGQPILLKIDEALLGSTLHVNSVVDDTRTFLLAIEHIETVTDDASLVGNLYFQ